MAPMLRCWLFCRVDVPLPGMLKFQLAAPPAIVGPDYQYPPESVMHNGFQSVKRKVTVPNFPFGNRAEANVTFRACVCCCVGNPDMPRSGCGPSPDTRAQGVSMIFTGSYQSTHASANTGMCRPILAKKCLGRE